MTDGNIFAGAARARKDEQASVEEKVTGAKPAAEKKAAAVSGKIDSDTPTTALITLTFEEKKKLKYAAIERNMSMSALVREFIAGL